MTLQDTSINNPCSPQGDTQLKLSHTTSTEPETVDVKWKREFDAYKPIQQNMSGCLIDTEHISTYFGKGQGTYPITTKVYMRARPTIQVWQKTPSFNKIDVVANQSDQLPILRRKMRCRPTLQDTTNPYDLQRDTQLKLSHPTPTDRDRRCQLAKRVSAIIHRDALRTPLTRNSRFPLHCPEETH